MAWRTEFTGQANDDLNGITDHLAESYIALGPTVFDAFERARKRYSTVVASGVALSRAPYQGTLNPHLGLGIRHVTKERAIFYFEVDEERAVVRVLAIFYGGQDHGGIMRKRMP